MVASIQVFCLIFRNIVYRDMFFYTIALLILFLFFLDEKIEWFEALTMFLIYVVYAIFMKYNESVMKILKKKIKRNKVGVLNDYFKNTVNTKNILNMFLEPTTNNQCE